MRTLALTLAAAMAFAGPAVAQATLTPEERAEDARAQIRQGVEAAGPATSDRAVSRAEALELDIGKDDASVSVTGSLKIPLQFWQYLTVRAEAPLLKDGEGSLDLAKLDGFTRAYSVEGKAWGSYRAERSFAEVDAALVTFCKDFWRESGLTPPADADGDGIASNDDEDCARSDFKKTEDEAGWKRRYQDLFYKGPAIYWGLSGKTGRKQFEFYDGATLAKLEEHRKVWSVSAFAALQPMGRGRPRNTLFVARYEHQRGYEDADSEVRCPPSAGPDPVGCIEGAIGAPVLKTRDLISLELRQRTSNFALAVTGAYDANNDVWSIDAPVYLSKLGGDDLVSGVRIGWRSDTDAVRASFFVSKAFDMTP